MIKIELIYVDPDKKVVQIELEVPAGITALEAIELSKLYETHPETKQLTFGIFSKKIVSNTLLKEGDRLEFYRPLSLDPKEKRRQLARIKMRT